MFCPKCGSKSGYVVDGEVICAIRCKRVGAKPKKRVKARNEKRQGSRFPERRNVAYLDWIRSLCCVICGMTPVEPDHVQTRGAGGEDEGNCCPLCHEHHMERHATGIRTFQRKYDFDLSALAQRLWTVYEKSQLGKTI